MTDKLVAALGMAGLASWCAALMLGPLLTLFPPYAEATWWLWPALRMLWVLGSALVMSVGLSWDAPGGMPRRLLVVGAATGLLSALFSFNPLLDLLRGPYAAQGALAGARIDRGGLHTRPVGGATPTIEGSLAWEGADGSRATIEPIGIQANRLEDALSTCPGGAGRLVVLRHLDVFVALDCTPPPPRP